MVRRAPYHWQRRCHLCGAEDGQPGVSVAVVDVHPGGGLRHMEVPLCSPCRERETDRAEALVRDQLGAPLCDTEPDGSAVECTVCGGPSTTDTCPSCDRRERVALGLNSGGEAA